MKYLHGGALTLFSGMLAAIVGCSGDEWPVPPASAGTSSVGGASGGTGGALAGSGGALGGAAPVGGMAGSPVAGAPVGGAAAGTGGGAAGAALGNPAEGKIVYDGKCLSCHGGTAAGGLGPNITGSMSAGIGGWGEAAFIKSIRDGVDRNGQKFCPVMPAYTAAEVSDAQLKNIYAYLLTLTSDTPNRGNGCP